MKPDVPPPAPAPTARQAHARRCFYLGITDPGRVARLWAVESARRAAAEATAREARTARARAPHVRTRTRRGAVP